MHTAGLHLALCGSYTGELTGAGARPAAHPPTGWDQLRTFGDGGSGRAAPAPAPGVETLLQVGEGTHPGGSGAVAAALHVAPWQRQRQAVERRSLGQPDPAPRARETGISAESLRAPSPGSAQWLLPRRAAAPCTTGGSDSKLQVGLGHAERRRESGSVAAEWRSGTCNGQTSVGARVERRMPSMPTRVLETWPSPRETGPSCMGVMPRN